MNREHKTRTLAFQLTQILAVYSSSFEQWRQDPSDVARYERTHANLDLVRVLTDKTFPDGSSEMAALAASHSRLKLMVLRRHMQRSMAAGRIGEEDSDASFQREQTHHEDAVAALRAVCLQRSGPDVIETAAMSVG